MHAPAKINLGLRILGRRTDGYHDLITVFQRLSLCDVVTVEPPDGQVEYNGPALTPNPDDNLCVRAARAFRDEFGSECGARIELEKHIPTGAGLGGGSSDAAAILTGMAQLYNIDSSNPSLMRLAAQLGSDVPFFLSGHSAALGTGRGELLQPCQGLDPDDFIVILHPGIELSTRQAYERLDEALTFNEINRNITICQFSDYRGGDPLEGMNNDFEPVQFAAHPALRDARDRLLECGARFAGLCGSGSALFGVFDSEPSARAASLNWRSPWLSFVCRPY